MGWTFNTDSPDAVTSGPAIAAVGITLTTLSFIVICLRTYVRGWVVKAIGIESRYGLGLHDLSAMPDQNVKLFGLLQYCGAPFYITSILGFKLSLLFMFLRIAVDRTYRIAIIIIAVACTCFHLCFLLVQINLCRPVAKQWDPAITWGSCVVAVPFYTSMASLTIVFDVIIIFTPYPMLIQAKLPLRKKAILICIFSLGIFITIIQIIRILTIKSLSNYLDSSKLILWSMVENNLGIIVASIPALAPLFKSLLDKTS
ncbi:hypothetical protein OIDMADRAFT_96199, partial [Oidiodendron maius Zn]